MKGTTQADLEFCLPDPDVLYLIGFSLKHLYADDTKYVGQEIVHSLTYEELIGTLCKARAEILESREVEKAQEEWNERWEAEDKCPHCLREMEEVVIE